MNTLKNIGKGNRVVEKRSPEEVSPAYKSEVNEVIDKINEIILETASINESITSIEGDVDDINTELGNKVPFTGADKDLNLGTNSLITDQVSLVADATTATVKNVNSGDVEIDTPANKTMVLVEPCYRDEYPANIVPASGAAAPDSVGHTIGGVARQLYSFDGVNTTESLSGSFEIPHDYMLGGDIEVHIHWRPATTGTGVVKWFFEWEYSAVMAAPAAQTALTAKYTIATNMQYYHLLTTFGNLPDLNFAIGGKIGFNIKRIPSDGEDTYVADALLEQVALHVPVDTLGSRQIYTK